MPQIAPWPQLHYRCEYIIKLIDNPWDHPVLRSIMRTERKHNECEASDAQLDEGKETV